MDFGQAAALLSVLIAAATAIPAAREQLRKDPQGFWKTLRYAAVYVVYIFFGSRSCSGSCRARDPMRAGSSQPSFSWWLGFSTAPCG